jgi:hypothetical protein
MCPIPSLEFAFGVEDEFLMFQLTLESFSNASESIVMRLAMVVVLVEEVSDILKVGCFA